MKWMPVIAALAFAWPQASFGSRPASPLPRAQASSSATSSTSKSGSATLSSASKTASTTSSSASKSPVAAKKKPVVRKTRVVHRAPPIQKAPTPERISEIQSALSRGGYYQNDPNGKWDADTVAALQKFQSANGLEPTGKLDALSLQKMGLGSDIAGVSAPRPIVHSPASSLPAPSSPAPASSGSTIPPGSAAAVPASTPTIATAASSSATARSGSGPTRPNDNIQE